jgi:hypothetical protein
VGLLIVLICVRTENESRLSQPSCNVWGNFVVRKRPSYIWRVYVLEYDTKNVYFPNFRWCAKNFKLHNTTSHEIWLYQNLDNTQEHHLTFHKQELNLLIWPRNTLILQKIGSFTLPANRLGTIYLFRRYWKYFVFMILEYPLSSVHSCVLYCYNWKQLLSI